MTAREHARAATERPVTGPGNTAVLTYPDPANGEETTLVATAGPGLPPVEHQVRAEAERLGVPPGNVRAVHTDLRPSLLPGGYTARELAAFPAAELSYLQDYGDSPEQRAAGVAGLVEHVELMSRITGQEPPPRPHRVPVPVSPVPAGTLPDGALGDELVRTFGEGGVRRTDTGGLAPTALTDATRSTLSLAGLPVDVPFFFTADTPDAPPPGGLFADAATFLRQSGHGTDDRTAATPGSLLRIGTDGLAVIAVRSAGRGLPEAAPGSVWALRPDDGSRRFVNASLAAYVRSLALLTVSRERMRGADPVSAGAAVASLQAALAGVDGTALAAGTWWSLVVEQMWHGLF